jgi:hypothetical protein
LANHVPVLLLPLVSPSRLMKSLKGFTAREANRLLGRTGEPFWQRESYDHRVRDDAEWNRIAHYIEDNPVKAGLVSCAREYLWSSALESWQSRLSGARAGTSAGPARTSACATTESGNHDSDLLPRQHHGAENRDQNQD